jgi:phage/plasmid primase-like uncharacterized protein
VRAGQDGRALFFCASCQDRNALTDAVARAIGQERQREQHDDRHVAGTRQRKQEAALRLWRGSQSATGTPAELYLIARGLPGLATSPALRFRRDTPHPEGGCLPALIALVQNTAGQPVAVHRTFLTGDGTKARIGPAKASLGPIWGAAIQLYPLSADSPLVIGEGIETAASAGRLTGFPAWAAVSAGNMAKGLVLPPEAGCVVIAADPDAAGRVAARDAWLRWHAEGREVQIATPDGTGDFNDLLCARNASRV